MKILVTGAKGFVGKNLCLALRSVKLHPNHHLAGVEMDVMECDVDTPPSTFERQIETCDFVFHLAGVNRPKDPAEFRAGNTGFTEDVLEKLSVRREKGGKTVPVMFASSIQAVLDNDYGRSKKAAEDAMFAYAEKTGAPVFVFRFANVFGKWCRPNYNSAVSTWCHNIARDMPIQVRDRDAEVTLNYIDDLVEALMGCLTAGEAPQREILSVTPAYTRKLGEITDLLYSFHLEPETLMVPDQADGFAKKLYATYLSYLPENRFSYPVTMHCDSRGSFTELLHSEERGQVSVNISKPGITKGQHWHHTKHEKFCVVSGKGAIQFRKMDGSSDRVIEYHVSGEKIEVVRIPPGYTHNIINEGDTDMVTVMWANEVFDPAHPDTFREEV